MIASIEETSSRLVMMPDYSPMYSELQGAAVWNRRLIRRRLKIAAP
jgi:hypothetical protein